MSNSQNYFKDINGFLSDIETRYPVEHWKIYERRIWPLIRREIIYKLRDDASVSDALYLNKFFRRVKLICEAVGCSFYGVRLNALQGDVLILHNNASRNIKLLDGTYFDHTLDPILQLMEQHAIHTISLECVDSYKFFRHPFFADSYVLAMDALKVTIRNKLVRCVPKMELEMYEQFYQEMCRRNITGVEADRIANSMKRIILFGEYFKTILKEKGIRVAILSCWYGDIQMGLSMACCDLGIPCIDVQHGFSGGVGHYFYSFWQKFHDNKRYEVMPSVFWCWNQKDADAIRSWGCADVMTYVGGKSIFLALSFLNQKVDTSVLDNIDREKHTILVALQNQKSYPDWFVDFIKKNADKYNWILRCHPILNDFQIDFVKKFDNIKNVFTDGMESVMLEILLDTVSLQITMFSSVVVDAALMGKPSVLLDTVGKGEFEGYLDAGLLSVVENAHELQQCIDSILCKDLEQRNVDVDNNTNHLSFLKSLMG